jgi:hypothetical protein
MKRTISLKYVILAIIIVLGVVFTWGYVSGHKKGVNANNSGIIALNGEVTRLTAELNDKTIYISSVEQEVTTLREAKKEGDISNKELKVLNLKQANEISRLTLKIDTILSGVSHTGHIIPIKPDSAGNIPHYALELPFTFDKSDKWLSLNGKFSSQGILDISLKLDFDADLIAGIDKTTKKNTALLKTTCPYIGTVTFTSVKLDEQKIRKYGIGLNVGYGVSFGNPLRTSPYVGIGVSYNIIRW